MTTIRYHAIRAALAILGQCNQRTKAVKNATRYLQAELAALPVCWANFHEGTSAIWEPAGSDRYPFARNADDSYLPTRPADFVSPSGSQYWQTEAGVIRLADHWCSTIKSCAWYLRGANHEHHGAGHSYDLAIAFCAWENFRKTASMNGVRGYLRYAELA